MYRTFLYILNSFGVHMIWLISVLSLMPKGEIVGIKSVLPLVTTLSNITDSTELRSECSVYRVMQCSQSTVQNVVFTEYSSECSVHRVQYRMQCSPSHHSEYSDYRGTVQSSVNRVNFLYRVSSGYRVQNYSRRLV